MGTVRFLKGEFPHMTKLADSQVYSIQHADDFISFFFLPYWQAWVPFVTLENTCFFVRDHLERSLFIFLKESILYIC